MVYAPHLPHEVIESTFEKINEKCIWITNDFNQMKLGTKTQIQGNINSSGLARLDSWR